MYNGYTAFYTEISCKIFRTAKDKYLKHPSHCPAAQLPLRRRTATGRQGIIATGCRDRAACQRACSQPDHHDDEGPAERRRSLVS